MDVPARAYLATEVCQLLRFTLTSHAQPSGARMHARSTLGAAYWQHECQYCKIDGGSDLRMSQVRNRCRTAAHSITGESSLAEHPQQGAGSAPAHVERLAASWPEGAFKRARAGGEQLGRLRRGGHATRGCGTRPRYTIHCCSSTIILFYTANPTNKLVHVNVTDTRENRRGADGPP